MKRSSANPDDPRHGRLRSGFTPALEAAILSAKGGFAAMLVDDEGELVDFALADPPSATHAPPAPSIDDLALPAAHWQIVARQAARETRSGLRELHVRAQHRVFSMRILRAGYVLLLVHDGAASDEALGAALDACATRVEAEAGWDT